LREFRGGRLVAETARIVAANAYRRVTSTQPPHPPHEYKQVVLEVKGETQLRNLSEKLEAAGVRHKLWIEQPEDYPTCLATKPYRRSEVGQHFKKLQLCKAALGGGK